MLSLLKWKHILSSKLFLISLLFFGSLHFCYVITKRVPDFWDIQKKEVIGTVIRVREKEYGMEVLICSKGKHRLRIFYQEYQKIQIGDIILVDGEFHKPKKNTIPNAFNYSYYLWYHREYFIFEADSIRVVDQTKNPILKIKRVFDIEISKRQNSKYLRLFLLGENDGMEAEQETFRMNGISHLFSISGMHFLFLASFISRLVLRKRQNSFVSFFITSFILFSYLVLIDFLPSACRAFLFLEFVAISRLANWNLSKSHCFWLMIVVILFWKPFYFFDIGFQFSAILNFFLCQKRLNSSLSKIFQAFSFSTFTFFVSLPIVLRYFYTVNFLSILWNLFFVPFVTFFFFPVQVLSFFLPFLSPFAFYAGSFFERVSNFLSHIDFLVISFRRPLFVWIFLYYVFLFLFCHRRHFRKAVVGLCLLILVLYYWNFVFFQSYFLMVDVGQGDCLLIHSNNQSMLIDTGGNSILGEGVIYQRKLKPLLQSLGIRQIDILCLSHGDFDHIGEAYPLIEDMKVGHVYFNEGDFSSTEEKVLALLIRKKVSYSILKEEVSFRLGEFSFYSLNQEFPSENDSSSVLLGTIWNHSFLLMGDASVRTEQYIMSKYQLPPILFLKVGHHGSRTSSSLDFLKNIRPVYSLISVGEKNRYGHPNLDVIKHLKQYSNQVYMTSLSGSILIKFKKSVTFSFFPP